MSLQGNLSEFGLQEILNFISDRKKSGRFDIKQNGSKAAILFNKGRVSHVVSPFSKDPLVYRLEEKGFVSGGTSDKMGAGKMTDSAQQEAVLAKNMIEEQDLRDFLLDDLAKDVAEIFSWKEADFTFDTASPPMEAPIEFKLEQLISEAISKSVRLRELKQELPPEGTPMRLGQLASPEDIVSLDAVQWEMVSCFTKELTTDELKDNFSRDSFTFYETLAKMMKHHILEAKATPSVSLRGSEAIEAISVKETEKATKAEPEKAEPEKAAKEAPAVKEEPVKEEAPEEPHEEAKPAKKQSAPVHGKYISSSGTSGAHKKSS